jgi:toxin CcdB
MNAKQFDVYRNPDPNSAKSHPYLVVLQVNGLDELNTRVVAPLVAPKSIPMFDRLMPTMSVEGAMFVIDPTNLAAVHVRMLKEPIANLESERNRILGAIDLVFVGI